MNGTTHFERSLELPAELAERAISLRGETEADRPFLETLYSSVRWQELEVTGWSLEQKQAFLQQQFAFQVRHYGRFYADADFGIVLQRGAPIGRLYLHRSSRELRIVDISLIPAARNRGIGAALIRAVFAEAISKGGKVTIHVEQDNPAQRLYRRLGFQSVSSNGPYLFMAWEPSGGRE